MNNGNLFEPYHHAPSQRTVQVLLFLLWAGIVLFGARLHPQAVGHGTHEELGLAPCPSILYFGRPCPGCGLTTSITNLIHGHWEAAFSAHPFGPFLFLGLTAIAFVSVYGLATNSQFKWGNPQVQRGLVTFVILFTTFGILRFALTKPPETAEEVLLSRVR